MKSVINEAKVTKRFNTGDYEFEEFSLGAVVDERESGKQVLVELKLQIQEAHSGGASTAVTDEPKAAKKAKKEEKKNAKSKPGRSSDDDANDDENSSDEDESSDGEGAENDEAANDDDADESDDQSDERDADSGEESDEDEKPKGKSQKGGKKSKKPQNYNRAIEQHKEIFSKLVGSINPNWKKSPESKAAAKKASEKMEGEEFLDENGDVTPEFKSAVTKLLKPKK